MVQLQCVDDGPDWSHQANAGEESARAATVATGLTCASGHDGGAVVFCGNLWSWHSFQSSILYRKIGPRFFPLFPPFLMDFEFDD